MSVAYTRTCIRKGLEGMQYLSNQCWLVAMRPKVERARDGIKDLLSFLKLLFKRKRVKYSSHFDCGFKKLKVFAETNWLLLYVINLDFKISIFEQKGWQEAAPSRNSNQCIVSVLKDECCKNAKSAIILTFPIHALWFIRPSIKNPRQTTTAELSIQNKWD